ncbi:MAG: CRTAC1 family protein, partial [Acidobacteriota bacterium]
LYLTHFGHNSMYRNNGDGTFTDITDSAGVDDPRWSSTAAFADWDSDGYLDLYVANYTVFDASHPPYEGKKICHFLDITTTCGPTGLKGVTDLLLWNSGRASFQRLDQGELVKAKYYGLGVMPFDANEDGLLDIYVANDTTPNFLFVNRGNRQFTEEALLYGLAYSGDGRVQAGMGIAAGDLGDDGREELIVTNFSHDTNTVYQNSGSPPFEDISQRSGFGMATFHYLSWGVLLRDLDLDGDLDIFIANGHTYPEVDQRDLGTSYRERNQAFTNVGGQLQEATQASGPGLEVIESSRAAVVADYDNDGDEDALVTNIDAPPTLLRNDQANGNQWLQLRLVGKRSNRDGIGALVTVWAGQRSWTRTVQTAAGYLGSNDPTLCFGLGQARQVDKLRIRWPSGTVDEIEKVEPGRLHLVVEGRGVVARR